MEIIKKVKKTTKGIFNAGSSFIEFSYTKLYGHFCIGFINFMLAGKILTEFTNFFSSNNFKEMII